MGHGESAPALRAMIHLAGVTTGWVSLPLTGVTVGAVGVAVAGAINIVYSMESNDG